MIYGQDGVFLEFVQKYRDEGMDEMEFLEAESNFNDVISEHDWAQCGGSAEDVEDSNG